MVVSHWGGRWTGIIKPAPPPPPGIGFLPSGSGRSLGGDGASHLDPRLLGLRTRDASVGRTVSGMRRVEQPGRGNEAEEAGCRRRDGRRARGAGAAVVPVALADVAAQEEDRLRTGIGELDNVLGGGIVPGSLVLIGGAPGIGKSTLTTMALANMVAAGRRTLYVSAEESAAQIRLRAQRLTEGDALRIPVIAETDLHSVLATLEQERPEVCVIDSVQTLHSSELPVRPDLWPGPRGRGRDHARRQGSGESR